VFADLPLEERVTLPGNAHRPDATVDYVFLQGTVLAQRPKILAGALAGHSAVMCDVDADLPKPVVAPVKVAAAVTKEMPTVAATNVAGAAGESHWWMAGLAAGGLVILLIGWRLTARRREKPKAAVAANLKPLAGPGISTTRGEKILIAPALDGTPVVHIEVEGAARTRSETGRAAVSGQRLPEDVRAGVVAQLSRWMKEKLTRRLISDRAELLATQRAATLKMMAVDERLTKIERQIQARNQEYESRISELEKELTTAREENRELIRAKIAQVKREMERSAKAGG
jgi:hypothetical protein